MYVEESYNEDYFWFLSNWQTNQNTPYLVLLVHEDDNGKIYGSDYFILLNRRYKEDPTYVCQADESSDSGSECSDDDEYDDNDF